MSSESLLKTQEQQFFSEVKDLLLEARSNAFRSINSIMSQTYWQIGKRIFQQEQQGKDRAEYGSYLIKRLAQTLSNEFGNGLSVANLFNFRQFYLTYPDEGIVYTLCRKLSWSHIRLIMRLEEDDERNYYIEESSKHNWSVRNLERHIKTDTFHRLISNSSLIFRPS